MDELFYNRLEKVSISLDSICPLTISFGGKIVIGPNPLKQGLNTPVLPSSLGEPGELRGGEN